MTRTRRSARWRRRRAHRRVREASRSRPPAGLPGRHRPAGIAADRLRRAERAPRADGAAGDDRRACRRHHHQGRRSCVASNRTACCARRRNSASMPMPRACWNCPTDAPVGAPLADYLGLPDASIELKLTPNRADCFSVRGIAFDVAAALRQRRRAARRRRRCRRSCDAHARRSSSTPAPMRPRYVGRVIEGVDAQRATPVWMAERLRRSGVRPISLLVDVTQYVMLELGQPMHAFDRDLLQGPVGVRRARAGESLQAARRPRRRAGSGIPGHHRCRSRRSRWPA